LTEVDSLKLSWVLLLYKMPTLEIIRKNKFKIWLTKSIIWSWISQLVNTESSGTFLFILVDKLTWDPVPTCREIHQIFFSERPVGNVICNLNESVHNRHDTIFFGPTQKVACYRQCNLECSHYTRHDFFPNDKWERALSLLVSASGDSTHWIREVKQPCVGRFPDRWPFGQSHSDGFSRPHYGGSVWLMWEGG
jgi:hypothetical protein